MAICPDCHKEMTTANGCDFKKFIYADGRKIARQKVGEEEWISPGERCGDCGAKYGFYHHFGCDIERCPICGDQAAFCDCEVVALET